MTWVPPPLNDRAIVPEANPKPAGILARRPVLSAGMVGLMVAAMGSATGSTATTSREVYVGARTREV